MEALDLSKYSMKEIAGHNLPVYICGAAKESIMRLLNYFREYHVECKALFTDKNPAAKDHDNAASFCAWLGIDVVPPPANVMSLPKGIVIYAGEPLEAKKWCALFSLGDYHTVLDANDLFSYPTWAKCHKYVAGNGNLLRRCRNCGASSRACPILDSYYRHKGLSRKRSIARLLVRCSFICNYKCDGCSQFIPYFTERHKSNFDGQEIIADTKKVASSLQYIHDIWLEGGEAMLWKPFPDLLRAVAALDNAGQIYVLTNGSYMPSESALDALRDNRERVRVEINAYETNSSLAMLFSALDKRGIEFVLRTEYQYWYDFRDTHFRNRNLDEIEDIRNKCSLFNRHYDQWMLTDGKFSSLCCIAEYIARYLGKHDELAGDFIDIRQTAAEDLPFAMERISDKRYFGACNYCAGAFPGNAHLNVARQLSGRGAPPNL
jgi:organic radical activating enzyme